MIRLAKKLTSSSLSLSFLTFKRSCGIFSHLIPDEPPERSIILQPLLYGGIPPQYTTPREFANLQLEEAKGLAEALELEVVSSHIVNAKNLTASHYLGPGKLEEIKNLVITEEIETIFFNVHLSPVQIRNLEKDLKVKVFDRFSGILEIFNGRAETKEAKLQVDLASLAYKKSQLVRGQSQFFGGLTQTQVVSSKQRGGLGKLSGAGEQQLELERRLIKEQEQKLRKELDRVKMTRQLHRTSRLKNGIPLIAVVGYTNAGKSQLVQRLTKSRMDVEDQVFATLDTKNRKLALPNREVIITDTVGFISDLPHFLVEAFRSTLEEALYADLILHVRDISNPLTDFQSETVYHVLTDLLKASNQTSLPPILEVWNKIDLVGAREHRSNMARAEEFNKDVVLPEDITERNTIQLKKRKKTPRHSESQPLAPPLVVGVIPISALQGTHLDSLLARIQSLVDYFKPVYYVAPDKTKKAPE